jgi:hypothetical protein
MVAMDTTAATTNRGAALTHGTRPGAPRLTTTAGAGRGRPKRSLGPDRLTVALFGVAALLLVLALLAAQLRSGPVHAAARPVRELRRVYQTTVVETLVGASGGGSPVTRSVSSSGSGTALSANPTTHSS